MAWSSTISTVALVGVTVWYAFQTQRMARSARDAAESSRVAAEHSARSAAVAAAAIKVNFHLSPVFASDLEIDGMPFKGVRLECSGAAVYVHRVEIEDAWALDPNSENEPSSFTTTEIFHEDNVPELLCLDHAPILMHHDESIFLEFPRDRWVEANVATLSVTIDYSFDARPPLRRRFVEYETNEFGDEA